VNLVALVVRAGPESVGSGGAGDAGRPGGVVTQQCEHVRPSASPNPGQVFQGDQLCVRTVPAEQWGALAAGRETGRVLLPDRGPRRAAPQPLVPARVLAELAAEPESGLLLVALLRNQPIGAGLLSWRPDGGWRSLPGPAGYLTDLAVTPGPLARSAVNLLLRTAGRCSAEHGRPVLRLACSVDNEPLRADLAAAGFSQLGRRLATPGRSARTAGSAQALYELGRV
jgi:hypothetical protein